MTTADNHEQLDEIGLTYVSDSSPGISRRRCGRGFRYLLPSGRTLRDPTQKARIKSLAIPPAYEDVWICPAPNGHIQATGLDVRGRKQYRYHERWRAFRDHLKFSDLQQFGVVLPRLRRRVRDDLKADVGSLSFTLAAMVRLLDTVPLRIGDPDYRDENGTFGATTLENRHLRLDGDIIRLSFTAKGGKRVRRRLQNSRLHKVLEQIADLPGRELFVWEDDHGDIQPVDSRRLNNYLGEATGDETITAKTFRTWAGSVVAFDTAVNALQQDEAPSIKLLTEAAAKRLHNTPAICRRSYIHPAVIDLAQSAAHQKLAAKIAQRQPSISDLRQSEAGLMAYLEKAG